ncbi:MAG: hypothetical protein HY856_07185 [Burkholderiales bacterium]|nr:hypothetical protein [Burkholderiales bacterium]
MTQSLNAWMNGELVGTWLVDRNAHTLRYAPSWLESPRRRSLSQSLLMGSSLEIQGQQVRHYFDNRSTLEGVAVLPDTAKAYFDSLWSAQSADAWSSLSNQQREFERGEFARGQCPNGSGFAARLSALYKENLSQRARAIAETLKKVHLAFDSPLGEGVEEQLREWGAAALAKAREALEDAYLRHLQSYGLQDIHPIGLEHAYALGQATVANLPARYLWEVRNIPAMHPRRQTTEAQVTINNSTTTINNSGTIGAVQTGPGATAHVQQQWVEGDTSALRQALGDLRDALERSQDVAPEARGKLIADVDGAVVELRQERPNKTKLVGLLSAVGDAVAFIGDAQSAYDVVKGLASALGIHLP